MQGLPRWTVGVTWSSMGSNIGTLEFYHHVRSVLTCRTVLPQLRRRRRWRLLESILWRHCMCELIYHLPWCGCLSLSDGRLRRDIAWCGSLAREDRKYMDSLFIKAVLGLIERYTVAIQASSTSWRSFALSSTTQTGRVTVSLPATFPSPVFAG